MPSTGFRPAIVLPNSCKHTSHGYVCRCIFLRPSFLKRFGGTAMGYRDDFYIAPNIIGYTGNLAAQASIYFRQGTEFGHITQAHPDGWNVGREKVRDNPNYEIVNELDPNTNRPVCVEKENGTIMHRSRNPFVTINTPGDRALAAQAITAFPDKKAMYNVADSAFYAPYGGVRPSTLIDPIAMIGAHRTPRAGPPPVPPRPARAGPPPVPPRPARFGDG